MEELVTNEERELLLVIKQLVALRKSLPTDIFDFESISEDLDAVIEKIGEAFILLVNR